MIFLSRLRWHLGGNYSYQPHRSCSKSERYTFIFEGNSQVLDNLLVSDELTAAQPEIDIVHVNAEFVDSASDHDPTVARFSFSCVDDVSSKVVLWKGPIPIVRHTGRSRQLVTLDNLSSNTIPDLSRWCWIS